MLFARSTTHEHALTNASFFRYIVGVSNTTDIIGLFEEFKEAMCEDFIRNDQSNDPDITLQDRHVHICLWHINACLRVCGKSISDIEFSELPQFPDNFIHPQNQQEEINIIHEREQGEQMLQHLNHDQRHIHDTIMNANATNSDENCYFVD